MIDQENKPKVSIIIPTYNRVDLLFKAIESVYNQSYSPIELIIIDDGSTDETKGEIQAYLQNSVSTRYFWKENGGCASARNLGLKKAGGELILFLDSDDTLEPNAIEKFVTRIVQTGSDFIFSPSIEVFPGKKEIINFPVAADNPEFLAVEHFFNTNIRNGAYLFSRKVLDLAGTLDEALLYNEDSDFVQRLAIHSKPAYLATPTVRVLNHKNNKSHNRVEILKALLRSTEKTLVLNPEFAQQLGARAPKRIYQLKTDLVKELIKERKIKEATKVRDEMLKSLPIYLTISLFLRTNLFVRVESFFQKAINRTRRFILNK